ncbi:MAG: DUF2723 domain-containing protein [Chloroflexi bacterium]|nr:DUF2723 domain-containing protein [Chloroflexota bacterium]
MVYVATLSPTITWENAGGDSGDFATAVYTLGVPHPSGYPSYMLLGKLFSFLPVGDVAYRTNLLSAVSASLAVVFLYLLTLRILRSLAREWNSPSALMHLAAAVPALLFGFTPIVWSQATVTEVYALDALLTVLVLYLLVRWYQARQEDGGRDSWRLFLLAAFVWGFGLGDHLKIAFVALPLVALLWTMRKHLRPAPLAMSALAFLVGLSVYVYLPIRSAADPPINWGHPHTWSGFYWTTSALMYRPLIFGLPAGDVLERVGTWLSFFWDQLNGWGLFLAVVGVFVLWQQQRAIAVASLLFWAAGSIYAIMYNTGDAFIYLIPAVMVTCLWAGVGMLYLLIHALPVFRLGASRPALRFAAVTAVMVLSLPGNALLASYRAVDIHENNQAKQYALDVLAQAEPGAVILTVGDRHVFSLWYARYVLRPDAPVVVLVPSFFQYDWYVSWVRRAFPDLELDYFQDDQYYAQLNAFIERTMPTRAVYLTRDIKGVTAERAPEGRLDRLRPAAPRP